MTTNPLYHQILTNNAEINFLTQFEKSKNLITLDSKNSDSSILINRKTEAA